MSKPPRITIITPSLNQGRYLERAMCSVIDQGYDNLEYIVIDGGSSDESVPLIQHYEESISYWHSRPDSGPADAINQALARATGDYVCIIPADGLLLPGVLHAMAERLAAGGDWIVGHMHRIDIDDDQVGRWSAQPCGTLAQYLMQDTGHLPLSSSFFRRELLARFGGFDAELRFAYGYEITCRLLAGGRTPTLTQMDVAAHREPRGARGAAQMLQEGREFIAAAERYANALPAEERNALFDNCDARRKVYALAEAECRLGDSRQFLWQQLLKRPWWLASDRYREALLAGSGQAPASPADRTRLAA